MGEIVPIIFLAVVLKVPVFFGMWLIYAAVRSEPVADGLDENGEDHGFRRWRREPKPPRGPRRGPHGGGTSVVPECPPGGRTRTRVVKPRTAATAAGSRR